MIKERNTKICNLYIISHFVLILQDFRCNALHTLPIRMFFFFLHILSFEKCLPVRVYLVEHVVEPFGEVLVPPVLARIRVLMTPADVAHEAVSEKEAVRHVACRLKSNN